MDEQSASLEDARDAPSAGSARLAAWGLGVSLLSLAAAGLCAALVFGQGRRDLLWATYGTGLAAAGAIGAAVVALLQRRISGGRIILVTMLAGAAALALTVWAQRGAERESQLEAREKVMARLLKAIEDFARANNGLLPTTLDELQQADLLADLPAGMQKGDYVLLTRNIPTSVGQLDAIRGDRQILLLHDGGPSGRDPAVAGMLDGRVVRRPWAALRPEVEDQDGWLYRLSNRGDRRAPPSRPADGAAGSRPASPATQPTAP